MDASHRFMKTKGGVTRFAKVSLLAQRADAFGWTLAPSSGLHARGEAHSKKGGAAHQLVVREVLTTIDSTDDAVECAAALAAWRGFGGPEEAASLRYDADHWTVDFVSS